MINIIFLKFFNPIDYQLGTMVIFPSSVLETANSKACSIYEYFNTLKHGVFKSPFNKAEYSAFIFYFYSTPNLEYHVNNI
jgi:hypothetical protein